MSKAEIQSLKEIIEARDQQIAKLADTVKKQVEVNVKLKHVLNNLKAFIGREEWEHNFYQFNNLLENK